MTILQHIQTTTNTDVFLYISDIYCSKRFPCFILHFDSRLGEGCTRSSTEVACHISRSQVANITVSYRVLNFSLLTVF